MSDGFGICGHKNNFNSKVRCGNWVEDVIGANLATTRPAPPVRMLSESKATHVRPDQMGNSACANYPPIDDVRIEYERQGVPSNIMFGHGMTEAHDPDAGKESRFGTINDLMFSGNVDVRSPLSMLSLASI
jgi:hypothetical protein